MKIDAADVQAKCVSIQIMNALKAAAICVQTEVSIKNVKMWLCVLFCVQFPNQSFESLIRLSSEDMCKAAAA